MGDQQCVSDTYRCQLHDYNIRRVHNPDEIKKINFFLQFL